MKKIYILICFIAFAFTVDAQVNHSLPYQKPDTSNVDSVQVENINKMPMDPSNNRIVPPSVNDTTPHRRTGDDEDPKGYNPKRK